MTTNLQNDPRVSSDFVVKVAESIEDAPVYPDSQGLLKIQEAVIVKKGTDSGMPTLDLVLMDADGKQYTVLTTVRLIAELAKIGLQP